MGIEREVMLLPAFVLDRLVQLLAHLDRISVFY
jgi:hypothetical protein